MTEIALGNMDSKVSDCKKYRNFFPLKIRYLRSIC